MKRKYSHAELLTAVTSGELAGRALHVTVLHDDACTPSICVCTPDYIVDDLTVDSYLAGQEAQKKWVKESTS